ncbi:MAG: M20 family metallopeptidase [Bryobacteraceae bacterium]
MFLDDARRRQRETIAFLREMVECESPSGDAGAVNRFGDLFAERVADVATVKRVAGGKYGKHLLCRFRLRGQKKSAGRVMALGHSDTVWPMGTLRAMPWREEKGRLWGPGVLDMKAGLAFFVTAMRILRDADVAAPAEVLLQINSDEEVGSHSSRALTEENARASKAVLVLEPGTGLSGKLKTARKGVGGMRVEVRGVSSHAGIDISAGANAAVELAWQIGKIGRFTNLRRGVTVNVGVIGGGTRTNVVPAEAWAEIDYRIPRLADYEPLMAQFAGLATRDKRCSLTVSGELNRPPFERTAAVRELFGVARRVAAGIGVELEESATGGGSDGNFTGAIGVPTLDGLGGVGEGAHAAHESILVDRVADRVALLAGLVAELGR